MPRLWWFVVVTAATAISVLELLVLRREAGVGPAIVSQLPGWAWAAASAIALRLRPNLQAGYLLAMISLASALAAGSEQGSDTLLYDVGRLASGVPYLLIMLLILRFPAHRERRGSDRLVLRAALGTVLVAWPLAWYDTAASPAFAVLGIVSVLTVAALVAQRWQRATLPARRVVQPILLGAGVAAAALLARDIGTLAVGNLGTDYFAPGARFAFRFVRVLAPIAFALAPIAILAGLLRTRVTRATLAEMVHAFEHARALPDVRQLIARALGDPSLQLGFFVARGVIDSDGQPLVPRAGQRSYEVIGAHGPLAVLVHDAALAHDDGLVETVASAARFGLENARLQADLSAQVEDVTASGTRLAAAADRTRERIERRMQGGAERRLHNVARALADADRALDGNEVVRERVRLAVDETNAALGDLRDLVAGLHAQVAIRDGIAPAIARLAERAALPVTLELAVDGPLSAAVGECVYFVTSETLHNVTKYATAGRAWVRASRRDGRLELEIGDDGVGGAQIGVGSGLRGVRHRVQSVGGSLSIVSPHGGGTTIKVTFPPDDADPLSAGGGT